MRQHRALRVALLLVIVVACAGYTLWWRNVADRISAQSNGWIEAHRAEGWTIEIEAGDSGKLSVGGFPFGWRLDAGAVRLARQDGLRAELRDLSAYTAPWSPHRVRVEGNAIAATLPAGTTRPVGTLSASHGEALLDIGDAMRTQVTLDAPSWRAGDAAPVASRHAKLVWEQRGDARNASLSLDELHLPVTSPLGETVQALDLAVTAEPPLPEGLDAASMQRWREASGVLQLTRVNLSWGPLTLAGEGTLALDAQGRVELAGTARLSGWSETIDALVASGSVKPNGGALAKAGLGMLAKPKEGGPKDKGEVTVAVAIQDGQLYLGGIRLGPAPPLRLF
ncbi:MAG: hypothetical protein JWM77_1047 [Rhodospirillales bacterium]|nr:hypothetical protein [Rhodospirillales bacterium]